MANTKLSLLPTIQKKRRSGKGRQRELYRRSLKGKAAKKEENRRDKEAREELRKNNTPEAPPFRSTSGVRKSYGPECGQSGGNPEPVRSRLPVRSRSGVRSLLERALEKHEMVT